MKINNILTIEDIQLLKVGDKVTLVKINVTDLAIIKQWDLDVRIGKQYTIKQIVKTDSMHTWRQAGLNNPIVSPGGFSISWGYWSIDKELKTNIKELYNELKKPYITYEF